MAQVIPNRCHASDIEANQSRVTVPADLCRTPRNIAKNLKSFKADEMYGFLLYFAPPLLQSRPKDPRIIRNLLARIYMTVVQEVIYEEDVEELEIDVVDFVKSYQEIYMHRDEDETEDLCICMSNMHGILHLPGCIRACGPAWTYWQFLMEKMNGNIVEWIRAKRSIHG
ncbi:hypothetical protein V1523DRAFT_425946 [Lipomyces doorenjongii]